MAVGSLWNAQEGISYVFTLAGACKNRPIFKGQIYKELLHQFFKKEYAAFFIRSSQNLVTEDLRPNNLDFLEQFTLCFQVFFCK